jgi:pimeloyl-ACP methyl ester carboxylesterase
MNTPDRPNPPWQQRVGISRTWYWRGWPIRYSCYRSAHRSAPQSTPQSARQSVQGAANPLGAPPSSKPPMLLVHGFGASIGHWRNNIEALGEHHDLYAIDLLGFGGSHKAHAAYSPLLWSELIRDFWQTFIGVPTILVGNSLGSVCCMVAAARFPEIAIANVWINLPDSSVLMPNLPSLPSLSRLMGPLRPIGRALGSVLGSIGQTLQALLTSPLVINPVLTIVRQPILIRPFARSAYFNRQWVDDELVDLLSSPAFDRGAEQALRSMTRSVDDVSPQYRARQLLPKLSQPTLLLWGNQDNLVPPLLGPKIAALNPRIRLVTLDRAGHCPQDECFDRINPLILDWIATAI